MTFLDRRSVRAGGAMTLLAAFVGIWLGHAQAYAAVGGGVCDDGERVEMSDPVVTLLEGTGDAAAEQALWDVQRVVFDGGALEVGRDVVVLERAAQ